MILVSWTALIAAVALVSGVHSICTLDTVPIWLQQLMKKERERTGRLNLTMLVLQNTNGTQPEKDDGAKISKDMFRRAVALEWCIPGGNATDEQYNIFTSSAATKANVSSRRELAMLLTNILHESDKLRSKEEQGPPYAPTDQDPAHPERKYHGRGYLMLRGYENYKNASIGLYGDERLVENPDLVKNETVAWDTAFWFWANRVHGQPGISEGNFGRSKGIISNYTDCGMPGMAASERFGIYAGVLDIFAPGVPAVEFTKWGDKSVCDG